MLDRVVINVVLYIQQNRADLFNYGLITLRQMEKWT